MRDFRMYTVLALFAAFFAAPSLGLAPILVSSIFRMIEKIHAQGKTILLVEQNARMALKVANRAYVLETGQLALEGNADEIRNSAAIQSAYLGGVKASTSRSS